MSNCVQFSLLPETIPGFFGGGGEGGAVVGALEAFAFGEPLLLEGGGAGVTGGAMKELLIFTGEIVLK